MVFSRIFAASLFAALVCSAAGSARADDLRQYRGDVGPFSVVSDCNQPPHGAVKCDPRMAVPYVREALAYLQHSPTARRIMARLHGRRITLVVNRYEETSVFQLAEVSRDRRTGRRYVKAQTLELDWDPLDGMIADDGGFQSSALGLIHEIAHITHALANPMEFLRAGDMLMPGYDDREEYRTIRYGETSVALELGEGIRHSHGMLKDITFSSPIQHGFPQRHRR